jgi:hypothetical protein
VSTGTIAFVPLRPASRWPRFAAFVALVALSALSAALLLRDGSGSDAGPTSADAAQLRDLSDSLGNSIYWAGPPSRGTEIELTQATDGSVYVRYLDGAAEVGDRGASFTTVGTYSVPTAFAALSREARRPSAITRNLPGGGLAVMDLNRPQSVYLAWPGSGYEVEVFDPSPKRALDLVLSGAIAPVR